MKQKIIPSRLVKMRERLDLTPSKLEKRAAAMKRPLTAKTITNIEKKGRDNNDASVPINERTIETLSRVLQVTKAALTGDEPLPAETSLGDPVSIQISAELALTYDLIERKYSIPLQEALNLAPLLLTIVANKSLQKQRLEVENIEDNFDYRADLLPADLNLEEFLWAWDGAIHNQDVFVKSIDWIDPEEPSYMSLENPFASFLIKMCKPDSSVTISKKSEDNFFPDRGFTYIRDTGIPVYSVCRDELEDITLGSHDASKALYSGVVRIKDIPDELWTPRNAGKRVEWLEEKYSLATSQDEADETT